MSYSDKEILRKFISESILREKLTTDAGDQGLAAGDVETPGAQGAASYADRWGWGVTSPRAEKAAGLAGFFGLPKSAVDFWDSLFGKEGFFAAIRKLATDTGKFFIDIFTKTIQPSPASPRVEGWTKKTFPKTNAFFSSPNKFSWGSSYGKAKIPSLGPKADIELDFRAGSRVRESVLLEEDGTLEFLSALTDDVNNLVTVASNIKALKGDVVGMVSSWQKIVDAESASSVLIPQLQAIKSSDLDLDTLVESFINDIAIPYIEGAMNEVLGGILDEKNMPDSHKEKC